mgnify:CR=1 FL=1
MTNVYKLTFVKYLTHDLISYIIFFKLTCGLDFILNFFIVWFEIVMFGQSKSRVKTKEKYDTYLQNRKCFYLRSNEISPFSF